MPTRKRKATPDGHFDHQDKNQDKSDYSVREDNSPVLAAMNPQQRAEMALHYRVMGYTYEEVAKRCDYANASGAAKAVKRIRAKTFVTDVRELTMLHAARIERGIQACMEIIEDSPKDRLWAVDRLVPLLKRQAELMALDAPKADADALALLNVRRVYERR